MSTATDYADLQRTIDGLRPAQVRKLRVVADALFSPAPKVPVYTSQVVDRADKPTTRRRLSFVGAGEGPPDLAERTHEYLAELTLEHNV